MPARKTGAKRRENRKNAIKREAKKGGQKFPTDRLTLKRGCGGTTGKRNAFGTAGGNTTQEKNGGGGEKGVSGKKTIKGASRQKKMYEKKKKPILEILQEGPPQRGKKKDYGGAGPEKKGAETW